MLRRLGLTLLLLAPLTSGCHNEKEDWNPDACYTPGLEFCGTPTPPPEIGLYSPDRFVGPKSLKAGECAAYSIDLSSIGFDTVGVNPFAYHVYLTDLNGIDISSSSFFEDADCTIPMDPVLNLEDPRYRSKKISLYLKRTISGRIFPLDGAAIDIYMADTPLAGLEWVASDRWGKNPYRVRGCSRDAGTVSNVVLTVTNRGNGPTEKLFPYPLASDVAYPGPARLANVDCPDVINAGQSCSVRVYFAQASDLGVQRGFISLGFLDSERLAQQAPMIFEVETLDCGDR